MLGSNSTFFTQTPRVLLLKRRDVSRVLLAKGYDSHEAAIYLKAYDYFCMRTVEYDGATVVKDLCDIIGLDLDAMLHDYHYVFLNAGASLHSKWLADWIYAKGNLRKSKGRYNAYSRLLGLCIISVVFVPYRYFEKGRISNQQIALLVYAAATSDKHDLYV